MADTPKLAEVPKAIAEKLERPDMVHVKLKKAQPGHLEGDVLYVDVNSARALVGRSDAEFLPPDKAAEEAPGAFQVARGRANVQTMVVKSADLPSPDVPGAAEATEVVETGTGAGTVVESESKSKRS